MKLVYNLLAVACSLYLCFVFGTAAYLPHTNPELALAAKALAISCLFGSAIGLHKPKVGCIFVCVVSVALDVYVGHALGIVTLISTTPARSSLAVVGWLAAAAREDKEEKDASATAAKDLNFSRKHLTGI